MIFDTIEFLKKTNLFKNLDDINIDGMLEFLMPTIKEYEKNQIIVGQGNKVDKIGVIVSGTILCIKDHYNGDTQILRIYKELGVLSLDAINTTFQTSPVSLISKTNCIILFLNYSRLMDSNDVDSHIKEIVLKNNSEILGNDLVKLMYKIDVLSKRTLEERVLTYLSVICEKKNTETIDISMNQEQFAQYLCVNRSVLSKELNRMRKNGIIDYERNKYTIYKQS